MLRVAIVGWVCCRLRCVSVHRCGDAALYYANAGRVVENCLKTKPQDGVGPEALQVDTAICLVATD